MLVGRSTTRGALSDVVLHLHLMLRGRFGFALDTAVFPTVTRLALLYSAFFPPHISLHVYMLYVLLAQSLSGVCL